MQVSAGTFAITRAGRFMENGGWVPVELESQGQRNGMPLDQSGIDLLRIGNARIGGGPLVLWRSKRRGRVLGALTSRSDRLGQ